jgi:hypothetical protein
MSVATDTVASAQIFVGTETLLTDVYGMKTGKQFVNTLEDNIRERGAMSKLISDRAQVKISYKVVDILLRALFISSWQSSEPHQQHQNYAENCYQTVKTMGNTILAPSYTWLLCLAYVCFILNFTVSSALNGGVPIQRATGFTNDISPLLRFRFWEPVYYNSTFPSKSREQLGRFVGIAENVGHFMTFKILTDDTNKILFCSNVRSALDPKAKNLRLDPLSGETSVPVIIKMSLIPVITKSINARPCPFFTPATLLARHS